MVDGYKSKTSIFGNSAENYVSRLLHLMRNPNGDRRPDLISVGDTYKPVLSIEVKSGKQNKGVLVDYQLHYAITTEEAYFELFREKPKSRNIETELFGSIPVEAKSSLLQGDPVAYYYCVIDRVDDLKSEDIDRPYSSVKCKWGNLSFVPPEFAFYAFAVSRVKRSGEKLDEVIQELKEMVKEDALSWKSSNYMARKGHNKSWQNLQGRDILALFHDDLNLATPDGRNRIKLMRDVWPDMDDLKKVLIEGPNETKLYALVKKEDYNLFDKQMRKVVSERRKIIERIDGQRKRANGLLTRLPLFDQELCFNDNGPIVAHKYGKHLKPSELAKLERLVHWLDRGEKKLTSDPF